MYSIDSNVPDVPGYHCQGTVAAVSPDSGALEASGRVTTGAVREPTYVSIANRTQTDTKCTTDLLMIF